MAWPRISMARPSWRDIWRTRRMGTIAPGLTRRLCGREIEIELLAVATVAILVSSAPTSACFSYFSDDICNVLVTILSGKVTILCKFENVSNTSWQSAVLFAVMAVPFDRIAGAGIAACRIPFWRYRRDLLSQLSLTQRG